MIITFIANSVNRINLDEHNIPIKNINWFNVFLEQRIIVYIEVR